MSPSWGTALLLSALGNPDVPELLVIDRLFVGSLCIDSCGGMKGRLEHTRAPPLPQVKLPRFRPFRVQ